MEKGENERGEMGFEEAVERLGATGLRVAFRREANSHRKMLERAKADDTLIVDPAWRAEFRNFLRDMGPSPGPDFTLDRIDTRRAEYGPGLCRWADKRTQAENRVNVRLISLHGEQMTIAELARRANRPPASVYKAINEGRTPEEIMVTSSPDFTPFDVRLGDKDRWHRSYISWLRTNVQSSKRQYAPPEVFDLITTSARLAKAQEALDAVYENLTPDEYGRIEYIQKSPASLEVAECNRRMDHALACLAAWYPKLAEQLTRANGGYRRAALWQWADWLKAPFK